MIERKWSGRLGSVEVFRESFDLLAHLDTAGARFRAELLRRFNRRGSNAAARQYTAHKPSGT
jgi:hypothetical protein